jgi:hypothetical protein
MPEITVLPFSRTEDGDFLAEAAIEVRSAEQGQGGRGASSRLRLPREAGLIDWAQLGPRRSPIP